MDWIEVYAEARVRFPVDVWLRTTEDHGAVAITAYRREWCPPLPPGFDVPGHHREVTTYRYARGGPPLNPFDPGASGPRETRHVLREYTLRYQLDDPAALASLTRHAAERWVDEAEDRARPYLDTASLVPLVREQLGGFGFAAMLPEPAILAALERSENHVAPAAYELASRATQFGL